MPTAQPDRLKARWSMELRRKPPRWPVWRESKGAMAGVAFAMKEYADADGLRIFPSAKTLGDIVGLHRNTVQKYRDALVDLNMMALVKQGTGRNSSSEYRLVEPSEWRDLDAEFARAMATLPAPAREVTNPAPAKAAQSRAGGGEDRDRVRALIEAATSLDALYKIQGQWPLGELGLTGLARDRAVGFQLRAGK